MSPFVPAQAANEPRSAPSNDAEVIGAQRKEIRACYNQGLRRDPMMQGSVVIDATIASDGAVEAATTAARDGLDDTAVECLRRVIERARFVPSSAAHRPLHVPVRFEMAGLHTPALSDGGAEDAGPR